ncbi:mammalian cell entry protein, partial [Acidovorax sp. HMWF029]
MNAPTPTPPSVADGAPPVETLRPVAYLELKAAALLLFTLALIVGSGLY